MGMYRTFKMLTIFVPTVYRDVYIRGEMVNQYIVQNYYTN